MRPSACVCTAVLESGRWRASPSFFQSRCLSSGGFHGVSPQRWRVDGAWGAGPLLPGISKCTIVPMLLLTWYRTHLSPYRGAGRRRGAGPRDRCAGGVGSCAERMRGTGRREGCAQRPRPGSGRADDGFSDSRQDSTFDGHLFLLKTRQNAQLAILAVTGF